MNTDFGGKQGTRFLINILFLSLIVIAGKKSFEEAGPSSQKENQVTFTFSLPSMNEMLGPTGETDLFTSKPIQWTSLSASLGAFEKALVFLPEKLPVQPMIDSREPVHDRRNREPTPPLLFKNERRSYRKKRADFEKV